VKGRLSPGSNDYSNPNTNPTRPTRHVTWTRGDHRWEIARGKSPGEITGGNHWGNSPASGLCLPRRWMGAFSRSRGQQLISMSDRWQHPSQSMTGMALKQRLRTSGGPLFSRTRCFSSRLTSTIGLLIFAIQFSALLLPQCFHRCSPVRRCFRVPMSTGQRRSKVSRFDVLFAVVYNRCDKGFT